jgi:hypothetical protein
VKRASLARALAATLLLGCAVDASLEGKRCPCAEGWECDPARNMCRRKTCDPKLRVSSLEPSWATAHSIRWQWEASGVKEDFLRYELWLAENEADLLARSGTARLIDGAQNPDIAFWDMWLTGDPVTSAITRGLEASTSVVAREYWAQVVAIDVALCASESNLAAQRTVPEAVNHIDLFENTLLPGTVLEPPALKLQSEELVYRACEDHGEGEPDRCGDTETDTSAISGQPLKVSGFSLGVAEDVPGQARITNGTFADAYLAARVRLAGDIPAVFAGLWLTVGTCIDGDFQHYKLNGFVMPNGDTWVDLELPLSALEGETSGAPLTYVELEGTTGAGPVCGFAVEGQWHESAVVRIDDVVLRF